MSEMERNTGRLKKLGKLTLGEVKGIVGEDYYNKFTEKYDADVREILAEAFYDGKTSREIVELNDNFYEVLDHKTPDAYDTICELKRLPDGTVEFFTQHYNGGAHWTELIEDEIDAI